MAMSGAERQARWRERQKQRLAELKAAAAAASRNAELEHERLVAAQSDAPDFAADVAALVKRWPMKRLWAWIDAVAPGKHWKEELQSTPKRAAIRKKLPELLARLDLVQQNLFPVKAASNLELMERAARWSDAKRAREMLDWKAAVDRAQRDPDPRRSLAELRRLGIEVEIIANGPGGAIIRCSEGPALDEIAEILAAGTLAPGLFTSADSNREADPEAKPSSVDAEPRPAADLRLGGLTAGPGPGTASYNHQGPKPGHPSGMAGLTDRIRAARSSN